MRLAWTIILGKSQSLDDGSGLELVSIPSAGEPSLQKVTWYTQKGGGTRVGSPFQFYSSDSCGGSSLCGSAVMVSEPK